MRGIREAVIVRREAEAALVPGDDAVVAREHGHLLEPDPVVAAGAVTEHDDRRVGRADGLEVHVVAVERQEAARDCVGHARYQPRAIHSSRWGDSLAIVVSRPWPGSTSVSAGSVNSRRSIDSMIVSKLGVLERGVAGAAREQRVAAEHDRVALEQEARRARRVAGRVDRAQAQVADLDHVVVGDHEVVARQHLGVLGGDADVDAGVAHLRDGLDVVEVAVRGEHAAHAGAPRDVEQQLVLVGRVDDHRVAVALAPQHEHVVLERPDDDLLDAHVGGLVVRQQRHHHAARGYSRRPAAGRRRGVARRSLPSSRTPRRARGRGRRRAAPT